MSFIFAVTPLSAQTGSGWRGTTSNDFQTFSNWDNGFGGNYNLFVGQGWHNAGRTGSTTLNNANSYSGYRLNYENIGSDANQSFTLQGSTITLYDFGGNTPAVINSSNVNQIVNAPLVFNPGGTGVSLIQANGTTGGNLTFGGTISLDTNGTGNQLRISNSGGGTNVVTFSNVISATGGNSVVASQGASNITVVYNAANTYNGGTFIDSGTLQFGTAASSAGSANNSALFLGQNSSNTPTATINLATTAGGVNVASAITIRASSSGTQGTRTISGTNTSGTNTFSGSLTLNTMATITSTNGGGTLALSGSTLALNTFGLLVNGSGNTTASNIISSTSNGGQLTKAGTGKLTLTGANTYTGVTQINGGTLIVGDGTSGSLGNTAVTVGGSSASGTPTLGGRGTIGGATTIAAAGTGVVGTHAPGIAGVNNGVGQQTFSSTLSYGSGSIFEWDLRAVSPGDPGVGASDAATGTYDSVLANGGSGSVAGGSSVFKVVLGGNTFANAFWDTAKSWTNIFSGTGKPTSLGSIFTSFSPTGGLASDGSVLGQGQFTFTGSTLTWTAVPEPSTAFAGLLLGAGLLRRRRSGVTAGR